MLYRYVMYGVQSSSSTSGEEKEIEQTEEERAVGCYVGISFCRLARPPL
jgi:hypothetical protein